MFIGSYSLVKSATSPSVAGSIHFPPLNPRFFLLNPITIFLGYLVDLSILPISHPFINPNQSSHDFHGFSLICSYFFQGFHHRCFVHFFPARTPPAVPVRTAISWSSCVTRGRQRQRRARPTEVAGIRGVSVLFHETAMWVKQCHKLSPKSP